jgi:hypothetical protein
LLPSPLDAQVIWWLAWDEEPGDVAGYAVTIDGIRVDYGLAPVGPDGTCGCSIPLPFTGGTHALIVSAYNSEGEASSPLTTGGGDLPSPWQSLDVGSTGQAGDASFADGVFTVNGSGADIWDTADAFQYVYQPLDGDGEIVSRVTAIQMTDPYAKAGVMLRETTAAEAVHVVLDICPDGNVEFMTRLAPGDATTYIDGTTQEPPTWLKLVRVGSTVTGYISLDGSEWTTVGSTSVPMSWSALIGLAVTSHDTAQLNTSTFSSVTVTAAPDQ